MKYSFPNCFSTAIAQVVENDNRLPTRLQLSDHVAADISGAARYQNCARRRSPIFRNHSQSRTFAFHKHAAKIIDKTEQESQKTMAASKLYTRTPSTMETPDAIKPALMFS